MEERRYEIVVGDPVSIRVEMKSDDH